MEVALGCKEGSVAAQHHPGLWPAHWMPVPSWGHPAPTKGLLLPGILPGCSGKKCMLSLSVCRKNTSFSFCVGLYGHKTLHSDHEAQNLDATSSSGIFMKYFQLPLLAFFLQGFCLGERYSILPEKLKIKMNITYTSLGYLDKISDFLWYGKNWIRTVHLDPTAVKSLKSASKWMKDK